MPQYFGQLPTTPQAWTSIGKVNKYQVDAENDAELERRSLAFFCGTAILKLSILSDRLFRVRFAPNGKLMPRRSWAVALDDAEWETVPFQIQENDNLVEILTSQVRLQIQQNPCCIRCYDQSDRPFARDIGLGMASRTEGVTVWKQIEPNEHFYGFGERTSLLNKRSEVMTNWTVDSLDYSSITDEMYQAIPFFIGLRPDLAYGIFLNTTCWSQFDLGAAQAEALQMLVRSQELDYYIIYGPTPAEILATYTQLTGRMPLPPRWALGYHQSRWSYHSEILVREVAKEFRDRQIPCDVIHLDIDYMQGYRVFTWNRRHFPDPVQLVQDLTQQGFKVVTIVDPGVKYEPDGDYTIYHEGVENDYFVRSVEGKLIHGYVWPDKAVFPDFLRPEVQQWWGDSQRALTNAGVAGIWNDMNEPALDDRPFGDDGVKIIFPLDAPQGPPGEGGTHAETHNLYGLKMAQAACEGLRRLRPNQRSFVLTRSGYAGIQRWSAVWTGDNHSQWEYLEMSLPMLCNLGLSGISFVGADIGGFASNATAELFARWMQVGMLYPLMRAHSALSSARHEPWVFGDRTEAICRDYINLRYQLLPYLYSLFWESSTTGSPILRPLLYHYPNDEKTYHLYDQVMLGPSLMAAPIVRPGIDHRAVYLPEGIWYDWWTGDRHMGPTHILAEAPLETMPLYARAGAVIPMQPVTQFIQPLTDANTVPELHLKIWPGTESFRLYEDDGDSFDYQNGNDSMRKISVQHNENQVSVSLDAPTGKWQSPPRKIMIEVIGFGEKQILDNGEAIELTFNSEPDIAIDILVRTEGGGGTAPPQGFYPCTPS